MAPDALGHLEVWLVTGSQELYGPATLRQVEAHAREVAAGLDAQPDDSGAGGCQRRSPRARTRSGASRSTRTRRTRASA